MMGIAIPRPQMRRRERLRIEANLEQHYALMQAFRATGDDRETASRKAMEVLQENRAVEADIRRRRRG